METIRLIISGKVQGVFYRASAKKKANELDINGWIRNTREGDVEAMVSAEKENIDQFVEWCKSGPEGATVSHLQIIKEEFRKFNSFEIKR